MKISEIKVGMTLRSSGNDNCLYEVYRVGTVSIDVCVDGDPNQAYREQDPEIFTLVKDVPVKPGRKEMKIRIREALIAEKFKRVPHYGSTRDAQRYTEVWSNGEDEIKLCWKVERKPTKKSK